MINKSNRQCLKRNRWDEGKIFLIKKKWKTERERWEARNSQDLREVLDLEGGHGGAPGVVGKVLFHDLGGL